MLSLFYLGNALPSVTRLPGFTNDDQLFLGSLRRKFLDIWVWVFLLVFFFLVPQLIVAYKFPLRLSPFSLRTI